MAQNVTTNAIQCDEECTTTASEMGKNASKAIGNATGMANQTLSGAGKNATGTGQNLLNQVGEVGKKVGVGAANVLSNISGELKKGLEGK